MIVKRFGYWLATLGKTPYRMFWLVFIPLAACIWWAFALWAAMWAAWQSLVDESDDWAGVWADMWEAFKRGAPKP